MEKPIRVTKTTDILNRNFTWATGIEDTFIPQVRPGLRMLDEYALTQHYEQWKEDFDRVAETGVEAVRWGIPWYRVQPAPDQWDWRWVDEVLDYLVNVKRIEPILDLMHYGTPLWLDNSFINACYPQYVSDYAGRVAQRYRGLVHYYTPLNEPMINAGVAGYDGQWPPYLRGLDGYIKLVMALAQGLVLTVQALKSADPQAVTIQVEALWYLYTKRKEILPNVERHNARQYLCWDLTTGRVNENHPLFNNLIDLGAREEDLRWLRENAIQYDVFGANFYPWAYGPARLRKATGGVYRHPHPTPGSAIGKVLKDTHERYHVPIMVTETSSLGTVADRMVWMDETIQTVRDLRLAGIPIIGYTWFPFYSMIAWEYRKKRRPLKDFLIHLGLYEAEFDRDGVLRRYPTPLVDRYQYHMNQPMPEMVR